MLERLASTISEPFRIRNEWYPNSASQLRHRVYLGGGRLLHYAAALWLQNFGRPPMRRSAKAGAHRGKPGKPGGGGLTATELFCNSHIKP
jgi:hypothetical protein